MSSTTQPSVKATTSATSGPAAATPAEEPSGLIFNIQPFSIHDGPGIRTTVFMKGCPLSCEWCANPDGRHQQAELLTRDVKCVRCGNCVEACPSGAITVDEDLRRIDWARCDLCLQCAQQCSTGALAVSGTQMTVSDLVGEVEKDEPFFRNSGGGITISGGEPLLQWEFAAQVFRACRDKGIHTTLDTSGHAPWEHVEAVLEHADLVLYDVKHIDPDIHRQQTGVGNDLILRNLERTARRVRTWIRIAVVPGFNDSDSDVRRIADFVLTLDVEKVSLLPYHGWGEAKYRAMGRGYPMRTTPAPSDERMEQLCAIVTAAGLRCTIKH
jgi:pyruvate formate lyase activating enzyme